MYSIYTYEWQLLDNFIVFLLLILYHNLFIILIWFYQSKSLAKQEKIIPLQYSNGTTYDNRILDFYKIKR